MTEIHPKSDPVYVFDFAILPLDIFGCAVCIGGTDPQSNLGGSPLPLNTQWTSAVPVAGGLETSYHSCSPRFSVRTEEGVDIYLKGLIYIQQHASRALLLKK